ncbi:MAG: 30S ribosomal protein S16 [Bacteroidales bacterium]|jgi:small subunit ribosomal protein S16|nr:30S ribosomal protein S16 [Bacteroidales bacterium]
MSVKLRLARHGRKRLPFYHIVVADSRAPRDGKYIERIGSYTPVTTPATIELDFEKALEWLQKGAKPSDTVRAILSQEGVLMKKHLLEGVKKAAFDEAEADRRYEIWMKDKELKLKADQDKLVEAKDAEKKSKFDAEAKVREEREKVIAERLAKVEAERKEAEDAAKAEAEAAAQPVEEKEEKAEEKTEEAPKEEAPKAEDKEEASDEKTEK